jgi:predicted ABC-type ATPase
MDYSKPTLFVISGPNGAGKSTQIQVMLPDDLKHINSFDRDKTRLEFGAILAGQGVSSKDITLRSTRMMEDRLYQEMKKAIGLKSHFVLETPLSHPDYWRYLDLFENMGYQMQLNYLCLDKVRYCVSRVDQRVKEGGHCVEPGTIKGVYQKNLEYINEYYKTFNIIELYDGMAIPTLLARMEHDQIVYADTLALKKEWIKKGLPHIAKKLFNYFGDQKD